MSYNQVIKNQLLLLKLKGVLECFEKQTKSQNHLELSFDERLTDLLQAEIECKNQRKVERLRKKSKIKYKTASLTDIDLEPSRNININLYNSLYNCNWVLEGRKISGRKINFLKKNYPNPFNPETKIEFNLRETAFVSIEIFNIRGQRVRTLVDSEMESGSHRVVWNGRDEYEREVGSGVYFYRMKTSDYNEIRKMILLK